MLAAVLPVHVISQRFHGLYEFWWIGTLGKDFVHIQGCFCQIGFVLGKTLILFHVIRSHVASVQILATG